MQATCPQCSYRMSIDDAKVPAGPFNIKCPKCQTTTRYPGKGAAAPTPAAPPEPEPPATEDELGFDLSAPPTATQPMPSTAGGAGANEAQMRAQMMAQLRREMGQEIRPGSAGRALVALPDRGQAGSVTVVLTRLGYDVDTIDDWEEGARLLEQGAFSLVVTSRAAAGGGRESLYQRACRLNAEARRRLALMLVGDEFKSGDGTQAWALQADLVVHSRDVANCDGTVRSILSDRSRLYQVFLEAVRRHAEAAV